MSLQSLVVLNLIILPYVLICSTALLDSRYTGALQVPFYY